MRSLRTRLLLAVSVTTGIVLILLGISIYFSLRASLLRTFDHDLLTKARVIASLTEVHGKDVLLDADDLQMPEFISAAKPRRAEYYELWANGNQVIARSPTLGTGDLPTAPSSTAKESFDDLILPSNIEGRMVALTFTPASETEGETQSSAAPSAVVIVARPTHDLDEVLDNAATLLWILGSAAVVVACAALWLLTRQAFRPLGIVARQIGALRPDALATHLSTDHAPSELDPVINKLNDLLTRLADAFSREAPFPPNLAHELRTPLAGLITTLEVCRSRPREPAIYQTTVDKCLIMANRMNQLVENLLLLARAESKQLKTTLTDQPIDLLLEECFSPLREKFEERAVDIQWQVASPLMLSTDPAQLRLIFQNLFDNALAYINPAGALSVTAARLDDRLEITIANTGSNVPAHNVRHLTERFWRADAARSDTGVHCGLGLAIVHRIAEMLTLSLKIESDIGKEFRVTLTSVTSPAPA